MPRSGATSKHIAVNVVHPDSFLGSMNNLTPETIKSPHNVVDISNGREKVAITLVNEVNDECLPSFHYIRNSLVFENAYLNFSLARIGDQSCCSSCSGDCLSASNPCVCAIESGAEFAYTPDGLVKEKFLEECISMARDPKKHCQFFCKECPLERAKGADKIEPCKGHLIRKFIKECWSKCSCHTQCGNRVIQRGISYNLQVFMTSKEKGWGLRTLVDLPKGAFVCEYAGEILTNSELYDRVLRRPKGERHTYPMLLDADWGAEGVLQDDEALCLDTTYYGNVGRFINHRCGDSNLVDIPVEVETSDHHIYHVAFFTTRKVKAMEELTWDYGIDFENHDHPIKAFPCQCGSKFCYNKMRSTPSQKRQRSTRSGSSISISAPASSEDNIPLSHSLKRLNKGKGSKDTSSPDPGYLMCSDLPGIIDDLTQPADEKMMESFTDQELVTPLSRHNLRTLVMSETQGEVDRLRRELQTCQEELQTYQALAASSQSELDSLRETKKSSLEHHQMNIGSVQIVHQNREQAAIVKAPKDFLIGEVGRKFLTAYKDALVDSYHRSMAFLALCSQGANQYFNLAYQRATEQIQRAGLSFQFDTDEFQRDLPLLDLWKGDFNQPIDAEWWADCADQVVHQAGLDDDLHVPTSALVTTSLTTCPGVAPPEITKQ